MTNKSKRKENRSASKTTNKGSHHASQETSTRRPHDVSANAVSETTSSTQAGMVSPGYANAGELTAKVLTPSSKLHASEGMPLQNLFQEWFEFVGMRMRQQMHLIQAIQGSRSLPDLQQAYSQFWQDAFAQYGEEARRMMLITQGAVDDAARAAHEEGAPKATLH